MPPPDDSSGQWAPRMPEAVRQAAERAEQLAREATAAANPDAVDTAGEDSSGPESTTVGNELESRDTAPSEASPAPVDNFSPAPSPAPTQPAPLASPGADWEQNYRTLQGKYNSELPELRGQIRSLQDLIASMQRAEARATQVQRAAPVVPQEDIDSYGQDLITASQRWAEAHMSTHLSDLERRLSQVESGSQQLARHTTAQGVEHRLDQEIPTWRQVNVDPAFILWLDQTDPFTGQKRQALLNDAYHGGDAPRTIAFFRAYQAEQTAVTPSAGLGTQPRHTNGGAPASPSAERLPLAQLAVPGRGQQAAPPASGAPDRRTWTNADIAAFYHERQRGRWAGREADSDALEQDIFAAMREGRIRQ